MGSSVDDAGMGWRDPAWIARAARAIERVCAPYHRAEVRGVSNIPVGAALYVGNHNGAMVSMDTLLVGAAIYRQRGLDDLFYALAGDVMLDPPVMGNFLRKLGAVRAHPNVARRIFEAGKKVLVYPGGDVETMRPWTERNRVKFSGRRGFVRLALRSQVPVIPIVSAGSHAITVILHDMPKLARFLGAPERMRLHVWPLMLSFPLGLTLGPGIPYVPLPVKIIIQVMEPIYFERTGAKAALDDQYVDACARMVEALMQAELDRLVDQGAGRLLA